MLIIYLFLFLKYVKKQKQKEVNCNNSTALVKKRNLLLMDVKVSLWMLIYLSSSPHEQTKNR